MKKGEHVALIAQLCDAMGEDIDTPVCKEVAEHLATCPECRIQFDSVKKTVVLCREIEHETSIPAEVRTRLFLALKLPAPEKEK